MIEKISALLASRRFWAAVGSVGVIALHDVIGVDESTANGIIIVVIGWIIGDSIKSTE